MQRVCDGLTDAKIDRFVRKWLAVLPHPFTAADRRAGFRYALSILQAEFSLTQVLDRPVVGRVFFDDVIRHNLDLGRPDRIGLIFDRRVRTRGARPTPGRFRTRVITDGVTPSLHVDDKHSKIKQYHKLGAALRTETTINDSYDFGIGRGLHNLAALRQVGFAANRRLLDVQQTSHDPFIGAQRLAEVSSPVVVDGDRKAPGLRFGDATVHALLQCLLIFRLHTDGFTNADVRTRLADALGLTRLSAGRMSYNLRRLRLHGLITRIPGSFRCQRTDTGLQTAVAYTLAHDRHDSGGLLGAGRGRRFYVTFMPPSQQRQGPQRIHICISFAVSQPEPRPAAAADSQEFPMARALKVGVAVVAAVVVSLALVATPAQATPPNIPSYSTAVSPVMPRGDQFSGAGVMSTAIGLSSR